MNVAMPRRDAAGARRVHVQRDILFPFLVVHAVFPAMWLVRLLRQDLLASDWLLFKIVADHFVAGDWSSLYAVGAQELYPGYPWRYPPFALYVVAPLAWLPVAWAYAVLAGVEIVALAVSVWLLQHLAPFRHLRAEWILAIVLSAPALSTIITGQSSALILLCIVGAATLWSRGRVVPACALLGLLAIKPNWGIVFGLLFIVRGEWKGVATMAGVAALLCLTTLPLGHQLWADFFGASLQTVSNFTEYAPHKQITLRAFLDWTLGRGQVASTLWALTAIAMTVMAVIAWRARGTPLRHLGIALLLAVAVNPYVFFYDGLMLAVPATVWLAEREQWERRWWLAAGALIAVIWCGEHWLYTWGVVPVSLGVQLWSPPVSFVGPAAAIWLVLAAHQAKYPRIAHPSTPATAALG